uniref:transposase n=1 Tax=Ralstonia pseudosolanacearum TaxID=1310165 RepID=UPI001FF8A535
MKKRFSEEQIIGFLKQAEAGVSVKELCRQHCFSDASFYTWRAIESALLNLKNVSARFHATLDAAAWPVAVV